MLDLLVASDLQSLGPLKVEKALSSLEGDLLKALVGADRLEGRSNDVVNFAVAMSLGRAVRDAKVCQNERDQVMPLETDVGLYRSEEDAARVVLANQIGREARSHVPIDEEDVALAHADGNLRRLGGTGSLADAKAGTSVGVATDDEASVPDHGATPLYLLHAVHADDGFAPLTKGSLVGIDPSVFWHLAPVL